MIKSFAITESTISIKDLAMNYGSTGSETWFVCISKLWNAASMMLTNRRFLVQKW